MSFFKSLGLGAVENFSQKVIDVIALLIVFNSLGDGDIAYYGFAVSSLFIFNLFLLGPESSIYRYYSKWEVDCELRNYLSAFWCFSFLKILLHLIVLFVIDRESSWFFAVWFSLVAQMIQAAEAFRICLRVQARFLEILKIELVIKTIYVTTLISLFYVPSIDLFFSLYSCWAMLSLLIWLNVFSKTHGVGLVHGSKSLVLVFNVLKTYSIWIHIGNACTHFIYNGAVFVAGMFGAGVAVMALLTKATRLANMFFIFPSFLQNYVAVVVNGDSSQLSASFWKLFRISLMLSVLQLIVIVVFREQVSSFLGVKEEQMMAFVEWMFWILIGASALNFVRVFNGAIVLFGDASALLMKVYLPSSLITVVIYSVVFKEGLHAYIPMSVALSFILLAVTITFRFAQLYRSGEVV